MYTAPQKRFRPRSEEDVLESIRRCGEKGALAHVQGSVIRAVATCPFLYRSNLLGGRSNPGRMLASKTGSALLLLFSERPISANS
jgi:hypothetical protein